MRAATSRAPAPFLAFVLAFLGMASSGCTPARPPLSCPARGGPEWRQIQSSHFVMKTDVSSAESKAILGAIEVLRGALLVAMGAPADEPMPTVEIVLFQRRDDFLATHGRAVLTGLFWARLMGDVEIDPVIVSFGDLTYRTRSTLMHELTHQILRRRAAAVPWWMSEGLAEYFSTLWVDDLDSGVAVVGAPPLERDFWEQGYRLLETQPRTAKRWLPRKEAPSFDALFQADRSTVTDANTDAYYTAAWKLVHVLSGRANPRLAPRFRAMMSSLMGGASGLDAFNQAYGDVPLPEIAAEYERFLLDHGEYPSRVSFDPPSRVDLLETRMSDAEVHALWARLMVGNPGAVRSAEEEIARGESESPGALPLRQVRASMRIRANRFAGAGADVAALMRSDPRNPRVLLLALLEADDALRREEDPARAEARRVEVLRLADRLASLGTSAAQQSLTASVLGRIGQTDQALGLSKRSIRTDPTCEICLTVRAELLLAAGRLDEAESAAERASELASDGAPAQAVWDVLRRIDQERAKEAPPAADGAP